MKILFISDEESKYYWDYYSPDKLEDIDLIISCGDLAPQYLSFLVTLSHVPVLYIHGNHDECYLSTPPEGCVCIDDDLIVYNWIRIMGLQCVTVRELSSLQKDKWDAATPNLSVSFSWKVVLIFWFVIHLPRELMISR